MAINFDPNKLNQFFDQQFGQGSFNNGIQQAQNAARLKAMAGFAKSDALKRIKALQAKAKKDQEYMDKYGMTYQQYQAKKEQDKLNKLQDKYQVLDNGLTSDQASKMRAKGDAEGRGGHQPSYSQQRKEAQQSAKNSSDLTTYDTSKMTDHNQELVNQLLSKQTNSNKKKDEGFLAKAKDFFTSKDTNGDGQRDGLLGLADRFILPISQAADEVLLPGNEAQQRKTELAKYGKIQNPAIKAGMVDRGTESKVLHGIGTTLGYVAPYEAGYGAVNTALSKLPKAAQALSKANPYAQRAIKGGLAGLTAETGLSGANELVNPDAYNAKDYAQRIALGTAGNMIADPLLHGIASNLNLKNQLNQVLKGTGNVKFDPTAFENAFKETFPATVTHESPSLLMSLNPDKAKAVQEAAAPVQAPVDPVKLKTVKMEKDISQMDSNELEDVWQQLHERKQQLIEQKADPIHLKAIDEDIDKVNNFLLKLDLQQFGAPKTRVVEPRVPTVPVEHVQTPLELELTKIKDISQFQVGTQHLYELADRLPKEMGDRIRQALDTAKINYAMHMENSANDLYDKVVKGLGIKKGSKESALVQDFGEKTLAKQFLERMNIDWKKLTPEQLDEVNLQQLQQKTKDWKKIVEADKYFRENYDSLLNQVNKVRKEVYPTNPEKIVPKRQDYYHHFNELTGLEGLRNLFDTPANIDPHLEGVSPYTRPQTKWQGFMQRRGLGPYKSDAVGGYLTYLKASSHSINLDPVIRVLRGSAKTIADATEYSKNANKIVEALQDHANDIAGKTNPYDRSFLQKIVGRQGVRIISNLNSRVKANMILGNLGSTFGQLGNLPLGIAKAKFHSIPAAMDTFGQVANWITRGEKKAPIYKSQFLKERFVQATFRKFDASLLDKPKNAAVWLLETADKAQSSFVWNAMYRKGLSKKVADPIKFADYETRKIVAGRGVGEVPLLQKAKTAQLLTPFTLEVANQWKVLREMVGDKDAGGIITFLVASAAINAGMEKIKGSEASYDPVGALIDGYMKKDGTTGQKVLGALASLNGETLGNIPGGNYIPQIMGMVNDKQKEAIFGDRSPDRFGTGLGVASTIFKPATDAFGGNLGQAGKDLLPLILPYGGNQIKKTYGGADALIKGGSYNSQGRMQYPVDSSNPADVLHALMFGATTTGSGQDFYNNKRQPLSVKQTSQVQNSSNPKETYNMVRQTNNIKSIQKKIDSVRKDRRLSPEAKQSMIQRLMSQLPAK
jgi:hypothetical protein